MAYRVCGVVWKNDAVYYVCCDVMDLPYVAPRAGRC
jgi:hypothetical protein